MAYFKTLHSHSSVHPHIMSAIRTTPLTDNAIDGVDVAAAAIHASSSPSAAVLRLLESSLDTACDTASSEETKEGRIGTLMKLFKQTSAKSLDALRNHPALRMSEEHWVLCNAVGVVSGMFIV